jgi:hypothetical protein
MNHFAVKLIFIWTIIDLLKLFTDILCGIRDKKIFSNVIKKCKKGEGCNSLA